MIIAKSLTKVAARLSQLLAVAAICLTLGTNTHVGAANTLLADNIQSPNKSLPPVVIPVGVAAVETLPPNALPTRLQVLSPKDAAIYRAIFAAQDKADWDSAKVAIAALGDKRLMGHVLADRYLRQTPPLAQLKEWLTDYASYPEAEDIYNLARELPDAKSAALPSPISANEWSGIGGYGGSFGFRNDTNGDKPSSAAQSFAAKIDAHLHHGDPATAEAILQTEQLRRTMSYTELGAVEGRIAASFFYEDNIDEARKVAAVAAHVQNGLGTWIAGLAAWKQNDPAAASVYFAKLATEPGLSNWDRTAAEFWAYRSLKRAGDSQQAYYWLRQASQEPRSFYGILAAQLLDRKNLWSWQLPELKEQNFNALDQHPAAGRALALIQIGRNDLAEDELRRLDPRGQRDLQEAMLNVASNGGMPSLTMQLGGLMTTSEGKYYDAALYPVPPWQPAAGFHVDRALMYALIRHESQFDPSAVSGRGACGLMQVMPMTAKLTTSDVSASKEKNASLANNNRSCAANLFDPAVNMEVGQSYVKYLANQPAIGDNLLLLLAAYNSGPGKIARWMDDESLRHDPLLFIESLPVRETREYVQQVMIHYWTYSARLNQPQTALNQLAHGEWPRYAIMVPAKSNKPFRQQALAEGFKLASTNGQ